MNKKVAFKTLGCKVNSYDTQAMLEKFVAAEYEVVDFRDFADVYVVNTCCVTNLADKKSRQTIGQARARNPKAIVVATGCASQAEPLKYRDLGVDIVLGTTERSDIVKFIENFSNETIINVRQDILTHKEFEMMDATSDAGRTRAFLKVQDGCGNFCSYCIIPYVRGSSRSRPFDDALAQAKAFALAGCKEIVVAGIHVASYGKDLDRWNLLDLLEKIANLDGIERLRLSSVEPMVVDAEFCDFIARTPKFCGHLHLSLQSGSDAVLSRMNRKYDKAGFKQAVDDLRKILPEINITTDIIAGFPGETDEQHAETLSFLRELNLTKLHIFPYAAKKGTVAAKMQGQLPKHIKNKRVKDLVALSGDLERAYYEKFIGRTMPVLFEDLSPDGFARGKTANYVDVVVACNSPQETNVICDVMLETADVHGLTGRIIET